MGTDENSHTIYRGRLITLCREPVQLPGGNRLELDIVHHPGGAVIVPLRGDGQVCLLWQYRYAVGGEIWEVPAGCIDPADGTPLQAARRELQEETGLTAASWLELGALWPSPGFCDERLVLYLARDLTQSRPTVEADELIEMRWLPLLQALTMAADGRISDAKSVAALFRARTVLDNEH